MDSKNNKNPLQELFTDVGGHIEPSELLTLLKPFIRIHRETMTIIFTSIAMRFDSKKKIILFILAKKAMFLLGLISSEWVSPKEIKQEFGKNIPSGTIDASIKRLSDKGVLRGEKGRYFIPDFSFPVLLDMFEKKE